MDTKHPNFTSISLHVFKKLVLFHVVETLTSGCTNAQIIVNILQLMFMMFLFSLIIQLVFCLISKKEHNLKGIDTPEHCLGSNFHTAPGVNTNCNNQQDKSEPQDHACDVERIDQVDNDVNEKTIDSCWLKMVENGILSPNLHFHLCGTPD